MKPRPWRTVGTWATRVGLLTVLGGAALGAWNLGLALDTRYAKHRELAQLTDQVERGQLRSDHRALKQEQYRLRSIPQVERRPLTPFERERLEDVDAELRTTEQRLKDLEQRRRK